MTIREKLQKFDKFWIGATVGAVIPFIAMFIFYFATMKTLSFFEFFRFLRQMNLITQVISFCVMPTFILYFVCYWFDMDKASRGTVLPTMLFTIGLVLWNF